MAREEEAIVWQALQQIPDLYREPLILFYREDRSVAEVAALLDVSPDAVIDVAAPVSVHARSSPVPV